VDEESEYTSKSIAEEEMRLRTEQQLLRKNIPINVHPYMQQTVAPQTFQG
jgi:hypothetical protein